VFTYIVKRRRAHIWTKTCILYIVRLCHSRARITEETNSPDRCKFLALLIAQVT